MYKVSCHVEQQTFPLFQMYISVLCCISVAVAEGGVQSALLPALEKPFSVFRGFILTPRSHRDIYRPLDFFDLFIFFPGRLELDERRRLHWGNSARSER